MKINNPQTNDIPFSKQQLILNTIRNSAFTIKNQIIN